MSAFFRYTVAERRRHLQRRHGDVNVLPNPNGPVPTAVNDPSAGAINVTVGQSVAVNVLANDTGNGGVLDPASVVVTTAPGRREQSR